MAIEEGAIVRALKAESVWMTITYGGKKLYFDGGWTVICNPREKHKNPVLYAGDSESDAVEALLNG